MICSKFVVLKKPSVASSLEAGEPMLLTLKQAADFAGVPLKRIRACIVAGELSPIPLGGAGEHRTYYFTQENELRLKLLATTAEKRLKDEPFVDDGKQTDFTVAQVAALWQLSSDTV
jgi:hypothetical protein